MRSAAPGATTAGHARHHPVPHLFPLWTAFMLLGAAGLVPAQVLAQPTDCTIFAAANGLDAGAGTLADPKSLHGANLAARAGDVVCLLGGDYALARTYYPTNSGTASAWITVKAYGDAPVNILWTAGSGASDRNMFHFWNPTFAGFPGTPVDYAQGPGYLRFIGLNLDGASFAADGFMCQGGHHLELIGNTIKNTVGSGIATVACDYVTSDHNVVNHCGYAPSDGSSSGWTSAISYNSVQRFDHAAGFHNIIANNILVGEYDSSSYHSDGNGIILDLSAAHSYDPSTADTPPALVVNNVAYGNGGRCITAYVVTNFWIVNNTCYDNGLDTIHPWPSIDPHDSHDGYIINNIAYQWTGQDNPGYAETGTSSTVYNVTYVKNLYFGGTNSFLTPPDVTQFLDAAPLFVNRPAFDPAAGGQYATALDPAFLGDGLTLGPGSPAIGAGIDPSSLDGLPTEIVDGLRTWIYTDLSGNPRPRSGAFDLGAYEHVVNPPGALEAAVH